MKKEYISPEVEIIEVGLHGAILSMSEVTTDPTPGGEGDFAREDNEYDYGNKKRPGSNPWDQNW